MPETLTPEQFVDEVAAVLPESSSAEAYRLIHHARAWAIVYYNGDVPDQLTTRINALEGNYANTVRC
jgi:hypothetical protein